ncbi:putative AAA-ATPase [Candidatus Electrothrix aarhusensis]|uniref:Putative AAA-ATPase n=1 Tax=Candidatus Electrothrix aarhusensis TaxID=1859131 RepID=A0A3S3QJ78_9BACT|nr:putative AAA-ATPase [Candidatus Electrothrix aarhusensis]
MKIPYGESDFRKIRTGDYLYIDKTRYIQELEEQGSFNILLRPRRFGKSLFLSTLRHYYDISCKDDFEILFGGLSAGKNPTPLRNSYQVLAFDFNGIETDSKESILEGFSNRVAAELQEFLVRYGYSQEDIQTVAEQNFSPSVQLDSFFTVTRKAELYILIDGYDYFVNPLPGQDLSTFIKTVSGSINGIRPFYETIKSATCSGNVKKIFITGVTSVSLDSMTSGFNICSHLSSDKAFHQAMGFTVEETAKLVQPVAAAYGSDPQQVLETISDCYSGYQFSSQAEEKVFSPEMILHFLRNFQAECAAPAHMLDEHAVSAYSGQIRTLFSLGDRDENFRLLKGLIVDGKITGRHKRMLDLDVNKSFERDDFISLLLHMGLVTICGSILDQLYYKVPNYVLQRLYSDYFKMELEQRA